MKNAVIGFLVVYTLLSILRNTTGMRLAPESGIPPEYINLGLSILGALLPALFQKFPQVAEFLKKILGGGQDLSNIDKRLEEVIEADIAQMEAIQGMQTQMAQFGGTLASIQNTLIQIRDKP